MEILDRWACICNLSGMEMTPKNDPLESKMHSIDSAVADQTGTSLLNWLTAGSIIASIYLYATGRKQLGIFIGLWPPTFQALKKKPTN